MGGRDLTEMEDPITLFAPTNVRRPQEAAGDEVPFVQGQAVEVRADGALPVRLDDAFTATLGGVPLDLLLTAVRGRVRLEVRLEEGVEASGAKYRIDESDWTPLEKRGLVWAAEISTVELPDGFQTIDVWVTFSDGREGQARGSFRVRNW